MREASKSCVAPEELSAYLDGDLDRARASEVEAHATTCAQCSSVLRDFSELQTGLKQLSHARPGLDLWRRIDKALDAASAVPVDNRQWMLRLLPISVAAVALLVFLFLGNNVIYKTIPKAPGTTRELAQAIETVTRAELAYREAIFSLEQAYENEKFKYRRETLVVIEQSLREIDAVIDRCRKAMAKAPASMEANRAMLAAYRQKMDFLFELVGPKGRPHGA